MPITPEYRTIAGKSSNLDSSSKITPLKVLLAEDEWLLCWSLERHLVRLGIEVSTASTGSEALRLLETNRYDWLITDFKLPEKDGFDLISAVKSLCQETRTILMTAYGSPSVEAKARRLGSIYIPKPFDLDAIARIILPDSSSLS